MSRAQYRKTVLEPGQTTATSDDVVVLADQVWTVGLYVASGALPGSLSFAVKMETPGDDIDVEVLTSADPARVIAGPGTFRVSRPDISGGGVDVGVFVEGR